MASSSSLICNTEPWKDLKAHVEEIKKTHLRDLMSDDERCKSMIVEHDGLVLDYSRQRAHQETIGKLLALAEAAHLKEKIGKMFDGEHINSTEDRSVLHVALRAPREKVISTDGKNVVPDVWKVLDKINEFSEKIRSGSWVGATGKALTDVVAVGIGGNFLGPLFVHTALQQDPEAIASAKGRQLRFLANVDPIDVARNITGLNPETTLVVVVSKTFTTAETMLNACTLREWITSALGPEAVAKHMVAVSTNLALVEKFGIDPNNAFAFWDWVGGRYSVCSAVGVLPLVVEKFLQGASSIDEHFYSTPFERNLPVLLGLLSVWNVTFLGYPARAILPYSQALEKLAPHIQQSVSRVRDRIRSLNFNSGRPVFFRSLNLNYGRPYKWQSWIHQCISTTSLSFKVNGSPTDFIKPERGIHASSSNFFWGKNELGNLKMHMNVMEDISIAGPGLLLTLPIGFACVQGFLEISMACLGMLIKPCRKYEMKHIMKHMGFIFRKAVFQFLPKCFFTKMFNMLKTTLSYFITPKISFLKIFPRPTALDTLSRGLGNPNSWSNRTQA
ncbi:glucose-6-phosphate isomerase [Ranunculus cassubicifolius]